MTLLALLAAVVAGASSPIRVGTSGDYAPFSLEAADGLAGFDIAVARAFADARGEALEWVRFGWPELAGDFAAGRFDVVMSGITVRPERAVAGVFTRPVVASGALALVRRGSPEGAPERDGALIAVNAGGHLERAARARFPRARIRPVPDNAAVPRLLVAGEVDAAVSDTLEAPVWLGEHPELVALAPFTRDRKAYWLPPGRVALARALDTFLAQAEADGRLAALRREAFGDAAGEATAAPLAAFLWTLRERLELMPLVAEAKRRDGLPVEAPDREGRVIEAALGATRDAARRSGRNAPPAAAVEALFRAQIEAAKAVQRVVLAGPAAAAPAFDLGAELRPALTRIGERVAALLVALPRDLEPGEVRAAAEAILDLGVLPAPERGALVDAVVAIATEAGPP